MAYTVKLHPGIFNIKIIIKIKKDIAEEKS